MNEQLQISENNLIVARENYNYWLQKYQSQGIFDRIINGTKSKLDAARLAVSSAETQFRELTGAAEIQKDQQTSFIPLLIVGAFAILFILIFLKYRK